jgi:hypothetical protein
VSNLIGELQDYFQENSRLEFAKCFEEEELLKKLAYLENIFLNMNQLNKYLQDPGKECSNFQ